MTTVLPAFPETTYAQLRDLLTLKSHDRCMTADDLDFFGEETLLQHPGSSEITELEGLAVCAVVGEKAIVTTYAIRISNQVKRFCQREGLSISTQYGP